MNKKIGIGFVCLSLVFLAATFLLTGKIARNWSASNELATGVIESPGEKVVAGDLSVDTGAYLQVTYTIKVESSSTARNDGDVPSGDWLARFSYPYQYRLLTESGEVIKSDSGQLSWNEGSKHWHNNRADSESGSAHLTFHLDKFSVGNSRNLKFEGEIEFEDPEYASMLEEARVNFYDNVTGYLDYIISGLIGLFSLGAAVICGLAGLVLISTSTSRDESRRTKNGEPGSPDIHDDGLLNFILTYPFAAGVSQFLITCALLFISFLILPLPIVFGYLYRLARSAALGKATPPEYKDWQGLFKDGCLVGVVLLPFIIPAVLLGVTPYFFFTTTPGLSLGVKYFVTGNIVSLVLSYLGVALILTLISTGSVTATYSGGEFINTALSGSHLKIFLILALVVTLTNLTFVVLLLVSIASVVGILIAPFFAVAFQAFQLSAWHALLGYLYLKEQQSGGLPPVSNPERLSAHF